MGQVIKIFNHLDHIQKEDTGVTNIINNYNLNFLV